MSGEWIALESTTWARAAYDEHRGVLRLQFRSGEQYSYANVPPQAFRELLTAPSKGLS